MIRVQVLGRFALEARGEPVHTLAAQPLRGSVFVYLCVEREATREALVRMFWPDREEDRARRLLSQTLYELKRALGVDWFTGPGELVRVENVTADVHGFESAGVRNEPERALACYQGRFLSDFQRFDSPDFNAWVDRKAAHYERLHRRARRERIKRLLEEGDRQGALTVAQRWSELDPLEDEAQHRTIELLHEMGRRSEALQTYETYCTRLREVDLLPLEDTRMLAMRVRESREVIPDAQPVPPAVVALEARPTTGKPMTLPPRRRRLLTLGAIGLVLALAAPALLRGFLFDDVQSAALPIDESGRALSKIAVLYFDDNTPDGRLEYLAKGLTEALIDELIKVDELSVVSRQGVKQFQNEKVSTDSIRRTLGVGTIVSGRVQQSGDTIRVNVDLVDASTGVPVESTTLSGKLGQSFQLEDDVVREVAAFLRRRLGRQLALDSLARGASDEEAYRLYQVADGFREQVLSVNPRLRSSDPGKYAFLLRSADSMLTTAGRRDPKWVQPILLRGWLAHDLGVLTNAPGSQRSNTHFERAIDIATRALKQWPGNAGLYELRGTALWRMAGNAVKTAAGDTLHRLAEADLMKAVAIDDKRAGAWSALSRLRQLAGEHEEAAMYAYRALQEDAFMRDTPEILNRLYRIEMDREKFADAEDLCRLGLRDYPQNYLFVECHLLLAAARPNFTISMDSAYALLRRIRALDSPRLDTGWDYQPIFWETLIARLWAKHGQRDSALVILQRARRAAERDSLLAPSIPFDAAHVLLLAGDTTDAVKELNQFLEMSPRYLNYIKKGFAFRSVAHLIKGSQ
jgi:DNA-binding SARP family transcriptional activator/TolB-like protein